jgi:FkbM family methyltransferase
VKFKIVYIFVLLTNTLAHPIIDGPISKQYIASFLNSNPVILEAGAHKGFDTIELAKLLPEAKIYAFEPIPAIFNELKNRCKELRNCVCVNIALADSNERKKIYVSGGDSDQSSSLLKPEKHLISHPTVTFPKTIEVNALTLDTWCQINDIKHIDFLWLDMQGYEFKMLKASPNILKTVKIIYTEINFIEMYKGCELFPEFKTWLENEGFVMTNIDYTWKKYGWGDALFVRKNLLKKE